MLTTRIATGHRGRRFVDERGEHERHEHVTVLTTPSTRIAACAPVSRRTRRWPP